ncbi:hypothetical protein HJG60_010176 [Phyllostomus discolor]|uniref:Uncharacterized protein n=1 Tax=Phyllostomus discolor TaxID=89673 RepID=A0A834B283_9CHIR|nr:hypothetical protein HJG60_010176 [Phyllostomus discolor]
MWAKHRHLPPSGAPGLQRRPPPIRAGVPHRQAVRRPLPPVKVAAVLQSRPPPIGAGESWWPPPSWGGPSTAGVPPAFEPPFPGFRALMRFISSFSLPSCVPLSGRGSETTFPFRTITRFSVSGTKLLCLGINALR